MKEIKKRGHISINLLTIIIVICIIVCSIHMIIFMGLHRFLNDYFLNVNLVFLRYFDFWIKCLKLLKNCVAFVIIVLK